MKLAIALLAALFLGALPLLTPSNYIVGVALSALIFTVSAAALNLVYGYTGLLSFAQLGFWGIGGYATALTVVTFGGNFWMGVIYAGLLNAARRFDPDRGIRFSTYAKWWLRAQMTRAIDQTSVLFGSASSTSREITVCCVPVDVSSNGD